MWKMKVGWDEEVYVWLLNLICSQQVCVPLLSWQEDICQLHWVTDASQLAYSAMICTYLHIMECAKQVELAIKVAPIKKLTKRYVDPNFLLSSYVMSSNIPLDQSYAWTDSTIVLHCGWWEETPLVIDSDSGGTTSSRGRKGNGNTPRGTSYPLWSFLHFHFLEEGDCLGVLEQKLNWLATIQWQHFIKRSTAPQSKSTDSYPFLNASVLVEAQTNQTSSQSCAIKWASWTMPGQCNWNYIGSTRKPVIVKACVFVLLSVRWNLFLI